MVRFYPDAVQPHVTRLRMTAQHRVPLEMLGARITEAAGALADARCDAVTFHCTANSTDGGVEGEAYILEAMKKFTSSARFKQCFVRQFFRYYMGRTELPTDDPLLRKMFFTFALKDDQDLIGLLRLLATSSHFSQRVAP